MHKICFKNRNNWRPYLTEVIERILGDHLDITDNSLEIEDVVRSDNVESTSINRSRITCLSRTVNENIWVKAYLGNDVVFKSSQTPLIYDPMSTIVFGYASCTGRCSVSYLIP